jgi:hypothetical protein
VDPYLEPVTIALVPIPELESGDFSWWRTATTESAPRAGPVTTTAGRKDSSSLGTVQKNDRLVKLGERIAELETTTPRRLRQLFPKGNEDPEWIRQSKAANDELEKKFAEVRKVLGTKLNTSSALPPAHEEQLYELKRNWSSETAGKLSWPFTDYQSLTGAIVPDGYRDEAPAVMVAYLKDRLEKLARIDVIVNQSTTDDSK